jgi:hypothetical protein
VTAGLPKRENAKRQMTTLTDERTSFLEFLQGDAPTYTQHTQPYSQSLPTSNALKTAETPRDVTTDTSEDDDRGSLSFLEFLNETPTSTPRPQESKLVRTSSTDSKLGSSGKVRRLLSMFETKHDPTQPKQLRTFSLRRSKEADPNANNMLKISISGSANSREAGGTIKRNRLSIRVSPKTPTEIKGDTLSVSSLVLDIGRANRDMSKVVLSGASVDKVREFFTDDTKNEIEDDLPLPVENEKLHALKSLLQDKKNGVPLLIRFAKQEYSQENVEAYLAVNEVLPKVKKQNLSQLLKQLQEIYDKYLKQGSFNEVNVSNCVREAFDVALAEKQENIEGNAIKALQQFQMYLLVNIVDTFTRLIKKEEYRMYCNNKI